MTGPPPRPSSPEVDLATLPERYRLILCDLWGCVHDGARILDGVAGTLGEWRAQGRKVVFVTNAPRSADAIRAQLVALGLDPMLDAGIVTAGEAGLAAVRGRGARITWFHPSPKVPASAAMQAALPLIDRFVRLNSLRDLALAADLLR